MSQQVIYVAFGASTRAVPIREYVKVWRAVSAAPPGTMYSSSLCGWWPATREEVLEQFREGLHARINKHVPGYGVGRHWSPDYQRSLQQVARRVNAPRTRVSLRDVLRAYQARLAHRLSYPCE